MKRAASVSVLELVPARRLLLTQSLSVLAIGVLESSRRAFAGVMPAMVTIENFAPCEKSLGSEQVSKVVKTEAEWRQLLPADSYDVTRRAGTERAGSGKYAYNHADGLYR